MDTIITIFVVAFCLVILMIGSFVAGVMFERRFGFQKAMMPATLVKTRGGGRLHREHCGHIRRDSELQTFQLCADCNNIKLGRDE